MNSLRIALLALAAGTLASVVVADDPPVPVVPGIIGMSPVPEGACIAVFIPMVENTALSGLLWYNNDDTVVFPEVLIASGVPDVPESVETAFLVAQDVAGEASDWSEVTFTEPVAAASDGFFVVFRLPIGSEHSSSGSGGGAGIGYTVGANGYTGWLSLDGEEWVQLHKEFGMAVEPVIVAAENGMIEKSALGDGEPLVTHTALLLPTPNPFNPQTELRYQLKSAGKVDLSIYNVKGERVAQLASGHHEMGRYRVVWGGLDDGGRRVASGVYLARFEADGVVQTHRLVMVK